MQNVFVENSRRFHQSQARIALLKKKKKTLQRKFLNTDLKYSKVFKLTAPAHKPHAFRLRLFPMQAGIISLVGTKKLVKLSRSWKIICPLSYYWSKRFRSGIFQMHPVLPNWTRKSPKIQIVSIVEYRNTFKHVKHA